MDDIKNLAIVVAVVAALWWWHNRKRSCCSACSAPGPRPARLAEVARPAASSVAVRPRAGGCGPFACAGR